MPVTIRPYGILKSYIDGKSEATLESGRTVRQAIQALGMPVEVVALVVVNEEPQSKDYVLQEGDMVKLLAVIGGG
jgi:sulfur carrier protein ThiS